MTTSPHVPDDDAPAARDEDFDDAGRYVGDDPDRAGDDRAAGDDRVEPVTDDEEDDVADEPPVVSRAPNE
jgi:hypothetical protein